MPSSSSTKTRSNKKTVTKKAAAKKTVKKRAVSKKKPTKKTTKKATAVVEKRPIDPTTLKRNPLGHLLIEKLLREAGFRGGVSSSKELLDEYSTDESIFSIRPQVVIIPHCKADVEIIVQVITRETTRFESLSITPRAAGTGLSGGSLTDSIVIDMKDLRDMGPITFKNKDYSTFTCEPGLMWRDMEKKLKRHKLYLPPYTSSKDICTIGGAIANNSAGPDSLRYGHCADWVESMDVVLRDGNTYTVKPLTYKQFKSLIKKNHEHARIAREIFELIEKNEKEIKKNEPETKKNTAGYSLWDVIPEGVAKFKKGQGVFDLGRIISGSQGTVGIITSLTMRVIPIQTDTTLLTIPIFDLTEAAETIVKTLKYDPINIEIFDDLTFDLALRNPSFFKSRLHGLSYYKVMLAMYSTYHVRYRGKTPAFMVLVTLDDNSLKADVRDVVKKISSRNVKARIVTNPDEAEMFWQIRRASYTLSKFQDSNRRPAAFLEDMTVPPENLSRFFIQIKRLFKEYNVEAAVHGHGGNGHFHFYPLLDFTKKTTPRLIEKMAEAFYDTAIKFHGDICGEHNDGIIRTPFLDKMFSKQMLTIFEQTEHIFDPDDIFNPGKKVNPRFDIRHNIRTTNF